MRGRVLALLLCACALAGGFAAVVVASPTAASLLATGTTGTTATTPTGPTTPTTPPLPPPPPAARVVADGVTVGGVAVGGMTAPQALAAVRAAFATPLVLRLDRHTFRVRPGRLGATAATRRAIARALTARPEARLPLEVRVRVRAVRRYVGSLAGRFDRPAADASYLLRGLRPVVVRERRGRAVARRQAVRSIVAALRANRRGPIRLRSAVVRPRVTRGTIGPAIVIRRESKRLYLYTRGRLWRTFPVATGQSAYPTPLGSFRIVVMWRNPWWYPPNTAWARGSSPIPPGPGNPLGTRWMGLSAGGVGIHGTPDAASIGYSASHGCIRMRIPDAEWLFAHVTIGTPVFIVPA